MAASAPLGIPRPIAGRVAVATSTLFGLMAGHALLETARDTLFLSSLPAARLPWVYLAVAALAVVVARVNRTVTVAFSRRATLAVTLAGAGVITAGFWLWNGTTHASLYTFYVWTGLVATVAVVQLWVLCGEGIRVDHAKRAFAVIGAGGLVGATVGAVAAGALLQVVAPRDLILAGAAVLLASAALPALAWRAPKEDPQTRRRSRAAPPRDSLLGNPYLRRLLGLVIFSQLAVTTADLLFKAVVAESIAPEDLGTFFAFFYAGLNAVSLVVQLLVASWVLRRLGVNRTLWVLPVLLGLSALGFALTAALIPVLLIKVFDGSLRHSLHRTGIELLYLPLPANLRDKYKVTIDAVGARGGQALASVVVLGALTVGLTLAELSIWLVAVVAMLLVGVASIKRHYVELFRQQLRDGTIETRAQVPELDLHSLEALIAALSSEDDIVVVTAMDLLEASGRGSLVTPLILYHPSREVVVRALDLMSATRRADFLPQARRLMSSIDPEVRTAALRAITAVHGAEEEPLLRDALVDTSAAVRATALVGLISSCCETGEVRQELRAIIDGDDRESRLALVRAIVHRPGDAFHPILRELAAVEDAEVQAEVARVVAASPDPGFLPVLLPMLGDRDARPDARAAMVAIGAPALEFLDRALGDATLPRRVRLHLPRTVSKFRGQAAVEVLSSHLERELDTVVGYKILRGLGRMIAENSRLRVSPALIDECLASVLHRALDLCDWRAFLTEELERGRTSHAGPLLVQLLREKEESAVERAFRLLGLRHPEEDFHVIHVGLRSGDGKAAASGRELLEYLVEPGVRAALLALAEPGLSDRERIEAATEFYRPEEMPAGELLGAMIADPNEVIAGLAAHHAAEVGPEKMGVELGLVFEARRGRWVEAVEQALRVVRGGGKAEAPVG